MKVLVVSKTSNLDLFGEEVRNQVTRGTMPRDRLERLEQAHADHYQTRDNLLTTLRAHHIEYTLIGRGRFWPELEPYHAIITVGGDGTVLEASHHIIETQRPIVGIRSSNLSVGRLCCGDATQLEAIVSALAAHTLPWVTVDRLTAEIQFVRHGGIQRTQPVLNDFLYTHLNPAATTRYRLQWGAKKEDQLSSGIWISTGVGSTAAIHTAGGEATSLQDSRFQFYVRELYSPASRPCALQTAWFTPEVTPLSIENYSERAILAFDGQHGRVELRYGDRVQFLRGPKLTLAIPDT